jgi:hypothetical protein
MNVKSYPCKYCGFLLGEDYKNRALELHSIIICGDCAQERNPEYHEFMKQERLSCL